MEIETCDGNMFYVKKLLTSELCQQIIETYQADSLKRSGLTVSGTGRTKLRTGIKLSTDLEIGQGGRWRATFRELNLAISTALQGVVARVPALQIWPLQLSGYKIQHYKRNEGHFKWHFDAIGPGTWDRQMAMIVYLNSVQEGGETSFYSQNVQIKPVAGDAVLFPTFWTHTHCGQIPRSEDKYIISSFVSFVMPTAARKTA